MNDKLNEFLKANGRFEEALKTHVVENASDIVSEKILNGKKDMKGCANYIRSEARKLAEKGCAAIPDPTVYAMVIEYFNNDDIKAEQEDVKLAAKTVHTKESVTKEEYAAAKEELAERAKKNVERAEAKKPKKVSEAIKDMTPDEALEFVIKNKKAKKVKKEEPENQVSLFDF